jgi:membrane protease YdiL (CAAX protease family)
MKKNKFPILIIISAIFWALLILWIGFCQLFDNQDISIVLYLIFGYTIQSLLLTYLFIKKKK